MAEPVVSNYVGGVALDSNTSLGADQVDIKSFTLAGTISAGATTISASAIAGITAPFYLLLESELVWVEGISSNDFTPVVRGRGGTTAAGHTAGITMYAVYAANLFNQLKRAMIAVQTELGLVPSGSDATVVARLDRMETVAEYNHLWNGGFDWAQRLTPGTLTTVTDNTYSADQWKITRENADLQYIRTDATGETGLTSRYYGLYKKITNAGKFVVWQPLEGRNSVPLRSKTVVFQLKMKASSSKTIRMAILELQNAGTLDTIPSTFVTAFGVDSTDPTFGANVAIITAAASKSVTTAWQSFSVSVTVPSNSKNIMCAFWTDADFAANDTLSVAEAGLFVSSAVQPWTPRNVGEELIVLQRYFYKTFPLDIQPAQNIGQEGAFMWQSARAAAVVHQNQLRYPVPMRVEPVVTSYNPSAANAQPRDITNSVDFSGYAAATPTNENNLTFNSTGNAATTNGAIVNIHIAAEAGL